MMDEKTYIGVLAITFGLIFFVVSLLTIFIPGFGDIHLAFLAWLASLIENLLPGMKDMAFLVAMILDWILVFGLGFTIGIIFVLKIRKDNKQKWNKFVVGNAIQTTA